MIKDFCKNNWQILSFNLLLLIIYVLFYGRFGDIIVDSFREAYIPLQVINGEALYKNIFTIYTPFAYLFNALLFLIFGVHLKILYFAGFLATAGILNLVYKISERFFDKIFSFGIVLFIISAAVLSPNVFNMIFPYSYGILYGLLFILLSIYFALRKNFFWAYFMYSIAVCSKYEFILFLPILVWFSGLKNMWKNLLGFFLPIFICGITLYIQGVGIEDLLISLKIMTAMSGAKTLNWFYSITGLTFRPQLFLIYAINIFKLIIPLFFIYKFQKWWAYVLSFIYLYFFFTPESLVFAFPLILILFVINYKKTGKESRFIIISSILISIKVFYALTLKSYGIFFLPFALIPLFILLPQKLKKSFLAVIILSSIILGINFSSALLQKNIKIETEYGIVYANQTYGKQIKELVNYTKNNINEDEELVIYPEGLAVNFLTGRKSENKFYSLIPLYVEIFGDDYIIERLKTKNPKYIAISNYDTSNYYYSLLGKDYGVRISEYINNKYKPDYTCGNGFRIDVYKRK